MLLFSKNEKKGGKEKVINGERKRRKKTDGEKFETAMKAKNILNRIKNA